MTPAARRTFLPWRVLVEDHGWSQECGHCERRVYNDQPARVWVADQVYCSADHQDRATAYRVRMLGEGQ